MLFELLSAAAAVIAGAVASVAGFGVGSLLTPLFAWRLGTKLAVAAVAVPHVVATALRLYMLRRQVDRRLLLNFGIASAVFGLFGALLHGALTSLVLSRIFGGLLILAGISSLTGLMEHIRLGRPAAWVAGALSGIFGGLVGNQGSIRSAALLGFNVQRDAFVATATAIALLVDAGRLPAYLALQGADIARQWPLLLASIAGVVVGTLLGTRILRRIPERVFKKIVGALVLVLGLYMLIYPPR
jgi:uncharacterized protein